MAETTALIEKKICWSNTLVPKTSPKNNSETKEEKILRERYISPEQRQKIIDDLRLI